MHDDESKSWIIRQLLPAQPDWQALFASLTQPCEGELGYEALPIIGWALVEDATEDTTQVVACSALPGTLLG